MIDLMKIDPFLDWKNDRRYFARGFASGMAYLHAFDNPIYHRDLKSSNCLISEDRR